MTGTADLSAAGEGAAGLHEPAGRRVALYQLYFDERSLDRLDPLCIPLSTRAADRYLENRVIADSMASGSLAQCDYLGFFSPRFAEKIPLRMWEILQRCSADGWQQPVEIGSRGSLLSSPNAP